MMNNNNDLNFEELSAADQDILIKLNKQNESLARDRQRATLKRATSLKISRNSRNNKIKPTRLGLVKTYSTSSAIDIICNENGQLDYQKLSDLHVNKLIDLEKDIRKDFIENCSDFDESLVSASPGEIISDSIWSKALNDFESFSTKSPRNLRKMVFSGIPQHFRPMAWQLLATGSNESVYKAKYSLMLKLDSPHEKQINHDITRTYPNHPDFSSSQNGRDGRLKNQLFNIVKAYSLIDPEVGYCQGLCFIAGHLLMHVPEEDAFSVFCELMMNEKFNLREYFKPDMYQVGLNIYILQCLVNESAPNLISHFTSESVGFSSGGLEIFSSFASSWFLTLFTSTFSFSFCSRIFDCLLLNGPSIIFEVGLNLILADRQKLQDMTGMEEILHYFNKYAPENLYNSDTQISNLINTLLNNPIFDPKSRKIKKREKEYIEIKRREAEEQIEINRLRDENSILRERIHVLEKENGSLSRQLATSRISYALQQEQEVIIRKQLASFTQQNVDHDQPNVSVLKLQEDLIASRLKETLLKDQITSLQSRIEKSAENLRFNNSKEDQIKFLQSQKDSFVKKYQNSQETIAELNKRLEKLRSSFSNLSRDNGQINDRSVGRETLLEHELMASRLQEAELILLSNQRQARICELEEKIKN